MFHRLLRLSPLHPSKTGMDTLAHQIGSNNWGMRESSIVVVRSRPLPARQRP
jgi:hypothetical protein